MVDYRFRDDDKFRNGRKNRTSEDRRFADGTSKVEGMSPGYRKDTVMSTTPTVLPLKEILEKHTPTLQVAESPKIDGNGSHDDSVHTQVRYLLPHEFICLSKKILFRQTSAY